MSDFFDDVFTAYCNSYNECASCPLGKETGDCRDLFARKMEAWAVKQVEMAAAETDTSSEPICQPRQNGKDENVPTKLPKWCKVGQWVMDGNGDVGKIVNMYTNYLEVAMPKTRTGCRILYGYCKPVRFMPYSYEEAVKLLGKTMEWSEDEDSVTRRVAIICDVVYHFGRVEINFNSQAYLMGGCATIDGVPFGIPEVDEEALKEVE